MLDSGLTIGVSMAQRLKYAQSLLVYGKQEMKTSSRMRTLYLEYKVSLCGLWGILSVSGPKRVSPLLDIYGSAHQRQTSLPHL